MQENRTAAAGLAVRIETRTFWWRARRGIYSFFRTKPLGAAAAVIIVLLILAAIFAPLISPYGPTEQVKGVVMAEAKVVVTSTDGRVLDTYTLKSGDSQLDQESRLRQQYPGAVIVTNIKETVLRRLTYEQALDARLIIAEYTTLYPDAWQITGKRLRLLPPGGLFWLGSDELGRDIFTRVVFGARTSLQVGIIATAMACFLGMFFGILSGYMRGWFDLVFQRFVDAVQAFPLLVLALVLAGITGPGLWNITLLLGFVLSPRIIRVVRGTVLSASQNQYVEAARAIGASNVRVMFRHIMPNVWAPVLVIGGILMGAVIIVEASLSFLGVGIPPPTPAWGGMLSGSGRKYFEVAWWMPIFPGVAISLAVLGWNLLGDALRDVLDPRLRGSR